MQQAAAFIKAQPGLELRARASVSLRTWNIGDIYAVQSLPWRWRYSAHRILAIGRPTKQLLNVRYRVGTGVNAGSRGGPSGMLFWKLSTKISMHFRARGAGPQDHRGILG